MSNKLISIIVPVYNSEKTLHRCIKSLMQQTYKEIEILLVMDGPTDTSLEIGKSFEKQDARIHVLEKENEGVSKARNYGLQFAKGSYIQFVDSDDYIEATMCEKLMQCVDNTGAKLVLCGYHHLFLERDIIKVPKQASDTFVKHPQIFLELYEAGYLNMPWNKLYKKDCIQKGFDESLSLGEDLLFNLSYMEGMDVLGIVKEPLYYYVQQKGQDTLSSKKREDKYEIAVKICESVKQSYESILLKTCNERINEREKGLQVIHKRFILEFLDEIEGLAYDTSLTRSQKLERISSYMKDAYIQEANQKIGKLQVDYQIINYFFKRRRKHMIYLLIYLRKWALILVRGFR